MKDQACLDLVDFSRKINMEFFAACAQGLEKIVGDELRAAKIKRVRPLKGGVSFEGTQADAQRALEASFVASRILQTLARIEVNDADSLYEGIKNIAWEDFIDKQDSISVQARGTNDKLRDTRFIALKAKDAICDRLRELRGIRPDVDAKHPSVAISLILHRGKVTVSLDLSKVSACHKFKAKRHIEGTLRETLAAALLHMTKIRTLPEDACLWDPMCGAGIVPIQAALMNSHIKIVASDIDPYTVELAQQNAQDAGVEDRIEFMVCDVADAQVKADVIVTNPPYGQRMSSLSQLPALYVSLRQSVQNAQAKSLVLITPDESIESFLHLSSHTCVKTYDGPQESVIYAYNLDGQQDTYVYSVSIRDCVIPVQDAGAQQFASRLNKVAKQRAKWAKQNAIFAYRVYDADLPDYNIAIDVYDCAQAGRRIHVAEYAPPKQIDPKKAQTRFADALSIIPVIFEVSPKNIYSKQRKKSKGGSQYTKQKDAATDKRAPLVTCENKLLFEVNLGDYLDTGLFLDHRKTRAMIRALAKGKDFLNLFAYTATASVYAAAGGASSCTTVDISNTYLDWAKRNMQLNGLLNDKQEFVRADVLQWVYEKRHSKERWDLIFVDPPTFSNSSKMGKRTWDVQADHAELLISVSRLLKKGGMAVFSCNLRKFKLDKEKLAKAGVLVRDITERTIPEDFSRNQNIHHCYLLKRA